ncbi:MAG: hypothetical protein QM698_08645 [Micropepsaceae bacterium]
MKAISWLKRALRIEHAAAALSGNLSQDTSELTDRLDEANKKIATHLKEISQLKAAVKALLDDKSSLLHENRRLSDEIQNLRPTESDE